MKNKSLKKIAFGLCILFGSVLSAQQSGSIKGTVIDKELNGEPILFANVSLKGLKQTVETNFHGNFEFSDLEPGKYTLVIRYLGYQTIEIDTKVFDNKITKVKGSLSALSFSMSDVNISEELAKNIEEVSRKKERPVN